MAQRICTDLRLSSLADALLLRVLSALLGTRLKLRGMPPALCECGSPACRAALLPVVRLPRPAMATGCCHLQELDDVL